MTDDLVRGAQGIADYLNRRLASGKPLNVKAVYNLIERGAIRVERTGGDGPGKNRTVWALKSDLDRFPGKAA